MPVLVGILKGVIIGGGLGFGFMQLGSLTRPGFMSYVLYTLIGALVGFVAGKPFWKHETIWTPVIKAIFGAAICLGLYVLVHKVLGDPSLSFIGPGVTATSHPFVFGGLVAVIYAVFVEWDDSRDDGQGKEK